ncbi:hypothetical protein A1O3_04930 [Capronia epimyces CBS 606.96]|uniref:Enoyl reductase (ER) domain-containing protein n=1 Tax=Capronia epimyces CBS 606.96 TaxID=1182542 RepID=W9XVJ6_9EURO|nr:uncharacterized protein A1O3_04930 [Capronia epimyces CBS 606.96]EXJ84263.1 hypothetical protein A1O3_04930 [Capronia epimyces CBS 606.96]
MRAIQILGDASSPRITTNDSMATPTPKGAEILVRVLAAGVTGDEVTWPEVYESASRIPGHEVSGIIEALGPEYSGPLEVGQDVVAILTTSQGQGQAEYTVCFADEVSRKPPGITHVDAAALPIPALTAWQAMVDHGNLAAGMTVLVTGASGAVGTLAVQLAQKLAIVGGGNAIPKVIALASAKNHDRLKQQFGVHEVHGYDTPGWEDNIRNVDLVFDTVGGDVLTKTWETVKRNGTIVTVGDPAPEWAFDAKVKPEESVSHPEVRHVYFIVRPDSHRLSQALEMVAEGAIKPLEVESFPFEKAELAWERARQRGRNKKVVITFETQ